MNKPRNKFSKTEVDEAHEGAKVAREFTKFNKVRLTPKQRELFNGLENAIISTVMGPPGSSKSFTVLYQAIKQLHKGSIDKIILVKPLETSGEDIGFLPGGQDEKVAPFVASFLDNLKEMVDGRQLKLLFDTGVIEFVPLAFMRGRTFKKSFIIADEMQNADVKQLMTLVTRFGEDSRVVIIGDQNQNDINKKHVALEYFAERILGIDPDILHFKFDKSDIVRHPLIIKIVDNYEAAQDAGDIPETKRRN